MDNNDKQIELTEDQELVLDKRILGVMLDNYLKVRKDYKNMSFKNEIKIILETIKIGRDEHKKINKELSEEYGKNSPYYSPEIDDFLLSCVVGGIVFENEDVEYVKENLHPNAMCGNRIKSIIATFNLLTSMETITEIGSDDIFLPAGYYCEEALDVLNMVIKNEQ